MLRKRIKFLLICAIFIFISLPLATLASEKQQNKGELEIKADRINKQNQKDEDSISETELDKSFPDLFKDTTKEKIEQKKDEEQQATYELKNKILIEADLVNTSLIDLKQELFTEEYVANERMSEEDEEINNKTISSKVLIGGLVLTIIGMFSGVYMLLKKWFI